VAVEVDQETVHQHKLEHLEDQVVVKEQGHQILHQELVMLEDLIHQKEIQVQHLQVILAQVQVVEVVLGQQELLQVQHQVLILVEQVEQV
jgi:hypothetical protein